MKKKNSEKSIRLFAFITIFIIAICFSNYNSRNNIEYNHSLEPSNNVIQNEEKTIKIHFIDVGQADSILIENQDKYMLIDGGNNDDGELLVTYLKNLNIKKLEYVIGTHADEDHIGGLDNVINTFEIEKIYFPKQIKTTQTYIDFIKAVKNKNMQLTLPKVNDVFYLGDIQFTILSPEDKEYDNSNNYSIVLKMKYINNTFLFMGDAESEIENELLNLKLDLKADLIKIGHHGSSSSSISKFLLKVNPKYAIISVGKDNSYGHPSQNIISRLEKNDVKIYRTDLLGTIIVASNGNNILIESVGNNYESYNR